jgi:hypothetical protein
MMPTLGIILLCFRHGDTVVDTTITLDL